MANYVTPASVVANYVGGLYKVAANGKRSLTCLVDKNTPEGKQVAEGLYNAIYQAVVDATQKTGQQATPGFTGQNPDELMKRINLPLKDGDTEVIKEGVNAGRKRGEVNPEFAGHWYFNASTKEDLNEAGAIADNSRRPVPRSQMYSGVLVRVKVWPHTYNMNGKMGVSLKLVSVVKDGDGPKLSESSAGSDPLDGFGLPEQPVGQPAPAAPAVNPFATAQPVAQPAAQSGPQPVGNPNGGPFQMMGV